MRKLLLGLFLSAAAAFPADLIEFGIKGGVPATDAFDTTRTGDIGFISDTRRWVIGPMIQVNLPLGLAVEFDALFRRLEFEEIDPAQPDIFVRRSVRATAVDFPLLLKIRGGPRVAQPYVALGPTFRGVASLRQAGQFFVGDPGDDPPELENRFTAGFTGGLGIRLGLPIIAISPEVRYTRWGWQTFRDPRGFLRTNPDQLEVLVGITF